MNIHLSYGARNTIILCILLFLVVSIGGYYSIIYYAGKIDQIDKQVQDKKKQIEQLEFVGVSLEETLKKIRHEEIKLAGIDKQIVAKVSPAATYQYLNQILSYSGFVKFDMIYTGSENKKGYGQNVYNIKGEGSFNSIYRFISFIEKGPEIYKIRKILLRGVESVNVDNEQYEFIVTFEMEILALYAQAKDLPKINRTLGDSRVSNVRNPFYPVIKKNLPPNFYELLEVERAELKAIIPGKAFIVDHKRNTHILEEGDQVYLGYIKKIDEKNNRVTFTLDKGGIIEDFILELRFSGEKK